MEKFDQIKSLKQETARRQDIVQFYENFQLSDEEESKGNSQVSEQVKEDVIDKLDEEAIDISSDENDVFDIMFNQAKEATCSSSDGTKYSRVTKRKSTEESLDYECEVCHKKFKKCWILVNHR